MSAATPGNLLRAMVASAARAAAERERLVPRGDLERQAQARPARPGAFEGALLASGINIVAECKRRSPSRGVLRPAYDPAAIARGYEAGGAAAISVLTEATFFDGALEHLAVVAAAVSRPVLRKDFIVSDYQVIEARTAGASAVLLIVGALDDGELRRLIGAARACGLDALVEVHDADELRRAVDAGATVIGINSRDLRTLEVHIDVFERLVADMPDDVVAVAESGLTNAAELRRLRSAGFDGFLMGERFMATPDPGAALRALRAEASEAAGARGPRAQGRRPAQRESQ